MADRRSLWRYHLGFSTASLPMVLILYLISGEALLIPAVLIAVNMAALLRLHWMVSVSYHVLKMFGTRDGFAAERMAIDMASGLCRRRVKRPVPPDRVLILLPHCLQNHRCTRRITFDPSNCSRCGSCPVGDILDLADRYGAPVAVATGGTLARRHVKEKEPLAVVAVACPRDLSQGMLDAWPVPVIGVENQRPCGDCLDTVVDLKELEKALDYLTGSA